jgi:serine protease Do
MPVIDEIQGSIAHSAERVGPAVVGLGRGWGLGSGVVVEPGQVLTSAHNLRSEEPALTFADGRRARAAVTGVDSDLDLAVLDVDTGSIEPIAWEPDQAEPGIGTAVVALANPGGRGLRATLGFVSSAGRSFRGPRGRRVHGAIEHTAPLPRGSSGGPLVDLEGRLLGLNSLRLEGGLILAVPATAVVRDRVRLLGRGEASQPQRLGVAVAPPRVARRLRRAVGLPERDGLLVRAVEDDSPAAAAGVAPGDLLVRAAEAELTSVDALYAVLDTIPPAGSPLELGVVRGTEERTVEVALARAGGASTPSAETRDETAGRDTGSPKGAA